MFCLECGAEMAVRARTCPVCGHIYGDRERLLAESQPAPAAQGSLASGLSAAPAHPAQSTQAAPGVKYVGELGTAGLPRDLPGRFVLGIALGMAADLLLPWVSVNGTNVTPASIGAPVIVVVALLAAATLPVFTSSLRQHPIWSALPLMVGAFCAGIALSVWLLLAPLTQIFAISFGSDPSNLSLSPQGGLYLFLLGSAVLIASGQRMLADMQAAQLADARRDAIHALQARQSTPARPSTLPADSAPLYAPWQAGQVASAVPVESSTRVAVEASPAESAPATPITPIAPVLPGSDAWHQAPAAPSPVRQSPGSGWGKSRGPQRLR